MEFQTSELEPIGYVELVRRFDLKVIPHHRSTYISRTGRGSTHTKNDKEMVIYPSSYSLPNTDDPLQHLEFAIKHDGVNLEIIAACMLLISGDDITKFIKDKPTGKYRRIIWFLYEFITGARLAIDDVKNTPYVDLLNPEKYFVGKVEKSKRHAVNNNLLGNKEYCPIVRKTPRLQVFVQKNLSQTAQTLMNSVDRSVLARATNYLYTKETMSSFGIEKIKLDIKRTEKFITLLEEASSIPRLNKDILLALQNNIVDETYKDTDYRKSQNYVGELTNLYMHKVRYISPKPEDLTSLMSNYLKCEEKLFNSEVYPVVIAAILSFGFVFLHPFEDGNGRIHRFIIHYVLSKTGYTPDNIIFPVSAVMLKNIRQYDEILETFSKPLLQAIRQYNLSDDGELTVSHDTKSHYQYIDYTPFVEYLFSCIESTIHEDFQEELEFIVHYDRTKSDIQQIVDMPDIKIDRIIRCIAQNNGVLGKKMRRTYFSELSDEKIQAIEISVQKEMLGKHSDPG